MIFTVAVILFINSILITIDHKKLNKLNYLQNIVSACLILASKTRLSVLFFIILKVKIRRNTLGLVRAMYYITLICVFLSAFIIQSLIARPNGASNAACLSLTPGHPFPPQKSQSPYTLNPSNLTVSRGQVIRVDIRTRGLPFGGFIIQARNFAARDQIVGNILAPIDQRVRQMHCAGGVQNSATHTSSNAKNSVPIFWRAPRNFTGKVFFKLVTIFFFELYFLEFRIDFSFSV